MKYLAILFTSIFFISCSSDKPSIDMVSGIDDQNVFSDGPTGWSMKIPDDFQVASKEKINSMDEKGKEALENSMNQEVDMTKLRHLLTYSKDPFNMFQSTSEAYSEEEMGDWMSYNQYIKNIIFVTLKDQGIKCDTSITSVTKIDGLDFKTFSFKLYSPAGQEFLNQIMYSTLIDDITFTANINYNNEEDKEAMYNAWMNSKFK